MNKALKQANFQIPEDLLNQLRETEGKVEATLIACNPKSYPMPGIEKKEVGIS